MSNQFNNDWDVLARLVREAGDPNVSPNPQYAETLRATLLDGTEQTETVAPVTAVIRKTDVIPDIDERTRKMKRIAKLTAAASILLPVGLLVTWFILGGGSTNIAFADVAKAIDNVRTATYDSTTEMKNALDGTTSTTTSKWFFLAPSRERIESSTVTAATKNQGSTVQIMDRHAKKALTLVPAHKIATTIDLSKIASLKVEEPDSESNVFEMVRKLVQEGSSSLGGKVEPLGRKVIDGREAIGFRTQSFTTIQTFWANPQTARLVRIEIDYPDGSGHTVMSNFRYDMELDLSLFSLEPPAGYAVNNMDVTMPVEDDLVNYLRLIAEHNDDTFPDSIGMTDREFLRATQAEAKLEADKFANEPATRKLIEELQAEYGNDTEGFTKALTKALTKEMVPFTQKITQKNMQGMTFYNILTSANDPHYVGKDVKLGTPDRPIFWYKPTGADKYRVIYADLSVREMTADEVNERER